MTSVSLISKQKIVGISLREPIRMSSEPAAEHKVERFFYKELSINKIVMAFYRY